MATVADGTGSGRAVQLNPPSDERKTPPPGAFTETQSFEEFAGSTAIATIPPEGRPLFRGAQVTAALTLWNTPAFEPTYRTE